MSEPRPKKLTPEMALIAAREIAEELAKYGHIPADEIEAHAGDIAKYGSPHEDGYDLAKSLENHCYWNCDFQMAETLDGYAHTAHEALRKAEKEWAEHNNIQPPLPIGQRVKTAHGEIGTIDDIYKYGAAQFLVKLENDPDAEPPKNARRIINFEDAVPA